MRCCGSRCWKLGGVLLASAHQTGPSQDPVTLLKYGQTQAPCWTLFLNSVSSGSSPSCQTATGPLIQPLPAHLWVSSPAAEARAVLVSPQAGAGLPSAGTPLHPPPRLPPGVHPGQPRHRLLAPIIPCANLYPHTYHQPTLPHPTVSLGQRPGHRAVLEAWRGVSVGDGLPRERVQGWRKASRRRWP